MLDRSNAPLAIVTGAAHRLGHDFAIALARLGYAILVHCNYSLEDANATAKEIRALGVEAKVIQSDLTVPANISKLFNEVDSFGSSLKILVNSASVMHSGKLPAVGADEYDTIMDLNLRAPLLCAQNAATRMEAGGLIVNISDVGAGKVWTSYPIYVASKAGLESFTRLLARSLAPQIRVNAIAPGLVYRSEQLSQDDWNKLVEKIPMRRTADHEEITSTLEFLIRNQYITGQTIVVDGGYSLV